MGRRIRNNYRWKKWGHAEATEKLDIRWLKKIGALKDDQAEAFNPPIYTCGLAFADLRHETCYRNRLELTGHGIRQTIKLVRRPTNFGGMRWYMLDEKGRPCEVLYLFGKYYASRQTAGLSYISQSVPLSQRLRFKKSQVERALEGTSVKGSARGANRRRLRVQRSRLERRIDRLNLLYATPLITQIENGRRQRRKRRKLSEDRLLMTARAIGCNKEGLTSETIVACYRPLLDELKLAARPYAVRLEIHPERRKDLPIAQLDIGILGRLGVVELDKLTGNELGWPQAWVQHSDRRVYILTDLRERDRCCAVIIIKDLKKPPRGQFFWLLRARGAFGREQWYFCDPSQDRISDRLCYGLSGFRLHYVDQPDIDIWNFQVAYEESAGWLDSNDDEPA